MFVIADIKGHQYMVKEGDKLLVERIPGAKTGEKVVFDQILLVADKSVEVGMPFVAGASVEVKILGEEKGDKIRVFKMIPKERYHRTQGHRQIYTNIEVIKIGAKGYTGEVSVKAEVSKKEEKTKVSEQPTLAMDLPESKSVKKASAKKVVTGAKPAKSAVKKTPAKKAAAKE